MSETTETKIVKYDPGAPLRHEQNLFYIRTEDAGFKHLRTVLNHAWPGDDLDPQKRDHKTTQLIQQATITISNSERPDSIRQCCFASVVDSLATLASLELSIQKALGEAYFVPFKGICTLMVGYRGFIKLLVNTGFVTHVESVLVYDGEEFTMHRDETGPHWQHKPDLTLQGQSDKVIGCYAVGYTRTGAPIFEYMNRAELTKVKQSSAAVRSGKPTPYSFWETEMMRKAPIRRLQKYIPKTADNLGYELLAKAVEHDNRLFDLKGYEQAQVQFKEAKQLEKKTEWERRRKRKKKETTSGKQAEKKPETTEPKAEYTDDGELIPDDI